VPTDNFALDIFSPAPLQRQATYPIDWPARYLLCVFRCGEQFKPSWQVLPTSRSFVGPSSLSFGLSVIDPFFFACHHRFRPTNAIEIREGGETVVSFDDNLQSVQMKSAMLSSGPEKDGFTFDKVFPMATKQLEVFDYGVKE
jgi:hypothetical protein